ncbi:hypothetical protein [Streptomyces cellulosae]|uniref:hypothetical protein n=1 Tax=Streptomyces cellulosae TaxID=1968 RepID=UPI000ABA91F5|nr:hypothetical protein [Streptomyces cellulosae]
MRVGSGRRPLAHGSCPSAVARIAAVPLYEVDFATSARQQPCGRGRAAAPVTSSAGRTRVTWLTMRSGGNDG